MARRIGILLAIGACWVAGTALGLSTALLGTDTGRHTAVRWVVTQTNARIHGRLAVGEVDGSFLRGLVVKNVTVEDETGIPLATVERVGVRYRVRDLLSGRIVFGRLTLERPTINLVQPAPGEPFNLARVFAADSSRAGSRSGLRPLIAFADVQLVDGSVIVRTPLSAGEEAIETADGVEGPLRVRRFQHIQALFPYLRISSPLPGDEGVLILSSELHLASSDPALTIDGMQGRVTVYGDSLTIDLTAIQMPASTATLRGGVTWTDALRYDLAGEASGAALADLQGLLPMLPPGLLGTGRFEVTSHDTDVLDVAAEGLDLEGRGGGGRLRGRLGMSLGPGERWAFVETELRLDTFDLEYVRGFLDTLPVAGRVTGRTTFDGPSDTLRITWDGVFRDSMVAGRPASRAQATGVLELGGPDGAVFHEFRLEQADISLATVRRLVPAVTLRGRLTGSGTLNGPWLNATYEGALRYADGARPGTEAQGTVRLDARGDTLGVGVDVQLDSLRLESFRSSYPGFTVGGAWSGHVQLAGRLDSLAVNADLAGPAGRVRGVGSLALLPDFKGLRHLDLALDRVDASMLFERAPPTSLTAQAIGRSTLRADGATDFLFVAAVDSSTVRGIGVDSAAVQVGLSSGEAAVDTLIVWASALQVDVRGRVAFEGMVRDTLNFLASTSSLGVLEPVLEPVLGPLDLEDDAPLPSGTARVAGRLVGSLDAFQVIADVELQQVRRGDLYVSHGGGTATWVSASKTLGFDGRVDSVHTAQVDVAGAHVQLHGRLDSLKWHGRSRFGREGAWIGGGSLVEESGERRVMLDSLGVLLASGQWFVDTAATVVVDDSGLVFTQVAFDRARPPGRVSVSGRLPFRGAVNLNGSVEALPVKDIWVLLQRDPEPVGGEVSGTLHLTGTARTPEGEMSLALRDGVFGEFRAPMVEAQMRYVHRQLSGTVGLWRRGERLLDVRVALPINLALRDVESRRQAGPVEIRAQAHGVDLSLLEATTPMVRQMSGTLDADFGITGTWERPQLTGTIAMSDGAASFPTLGVRDEQVNGLLRLSGDRINIERLSMRSGQGQAEIGGSIRLEELSRPVLELTINAREFRTIDVRDFLTLTATADLKLEGPLYQARMSGTATATRGVLYFADLISKDIVNLQDTLFREFVDTTLLRRQGLGPEFESRFLDSLRIDSLQVQMGNDFWLRSSEANIQLAGRVFVNKLRDRYRLDGALQTPRGTYRLQLGPGTTREFTVTRGEVRYFGTADLNADLDIDARHVVRTVRREDVTVSVHIGGTLYEPQLRLSSDIRPPISETEIISYLLVGAPSFQAGVDASGFGARFALQGLLGTLSSQFEYALISDFGLPIDYFQLRPATGAGEVAGVEIAAGKQLEVLGKTAFLTLSPRVCPRDLGFGASLEFSLSRRWLVSASLEPVRSCEVLTAPLSGLYQFGLDVFWETSY